MYCRHATVAVDQPGRVTHEILDRDLPIRWRLVDNRVASGIHDSDTHVGELWIVLRQRFVNQQLALLVKGQGRDRSEGLRHRRDVENRVGRHWDAGHFVLVAECLKIDQLTLAGDSQHRAGESVGSDIRVERTFLSSFPHLLKHRQGRDCAW